MAWSGTSYNNPSASYLSQGIDISRINAAGIICIRVQNYWTKCGRLFDDGNFDGLRDSLNVLWTEFYADATQKQKDFVVAIDRKIKNAMALRSQSGKNGKFAHYDSTYKQLIYEKWLFMKTLEKAQGIGKAYIDKDEDDWD